MSEISFINLIYPLALQVEKETGIPALAITAQSALETGWGSSAPGNMYFGIKAGSNWTGRTQYLWTWEEVNGIATKVKALFRAYDSPIDSLRDYAKLITSNSRYATALKTSDPYKYATELQKAGYATDSKYASKIAALIDIIKKKSLK